MPTEYEKASRSAVIATVLIVGRGSKEARKTAKIDVMFSSKTDLWETPQWLFDKYNQEYQFTLDACAIPENAKCPRFFSPEQDGLSQEWTGRVWCNPPYGRQIGKWVQKAYESKAEVVVMLLPARTDTSWFHDLCLRGGASVFPARTAQIRRGEKLCSVSQHDSCIRQEAKTND